MDNFDIPMGAYDLAQVADSIRIYILGHVGSYCQFRAGGALPG